MSLGFPRAGSEVPYSYSCVSVSIPTIAINQVAESIVLAFRNNTADRASQEFIHLFLAGRLTKIGNHLLLLKNVFVDDQFAISDSKGTLTAVTSVMFPISLGELPKHLVDKLIKLLSEHPGCMNLLKQKLCKDRRTSFTVGSQRMRNKVHAGSLLHGGPNLQE
jgi:hypothetical protein